MPTEIKFNNSNTQKINYTYAANRTKLRKVTNNNGAVTTTDYAGNYVYENNTLKQFNQPEGYVEPDGSGWQYVYRITDIWGNTRITFADDNNNGSVNSSEIRREQNYYPFGLEHKGYNNSSYGAKNNLKTYQKQEFTEDLGLNTHEWKYRISDPAIGRFWQIDPLAEDYMYNSTYAFQENKMGMGVELEGLELEAWVNIAVNTGDALTGGKVTETMDVVSGFIPILGQGRDIAEAITGQNIITGESLSVGERLITLIPGKFEKVGDVTNAIVKKGDDVLDATKIEKRAEKLNKVDRPGKDFTKAGKENVIDQNKLKNNGKTICEGCSTETIPATKDVKGVSTPKNRTEVDHIDRKRNGGSGTPNNGQVLCNGCNNKKG